MDWYADISKLLLVRYLELYLYFHLLSFYISKFWKYKCDAYLHIRINLDAHFFNLTSAYFLESEEE